METKTTSSELAPYIAAAQGTLLVWPAVGVMAALFFSSFHFDSGLVKAIAMILYVVGIFAVVGWQVKRSGVQPRFGPMPAELKRNMYAFWLASTVIIGLALVLAFTTNFLLAAVVIGLSFTAVGLAYHLRSRSIVANLKAAQ